ncbi:MAG: PAS domain-containing sensor histidine kinase [Phormidesmis sp.]
MLEFIMGLLVGLVMLEIHRRRGDAKLKRLLGRLEDSRPLPTLGYDAQIASAIAAQKAIAHNINEQLEDFRQVLQNAPIGYLQVDEENQLVWCNRRAQEFLDISQGDYAQPRLLLAIVRSYELDQLVERTRQTQTMCQARWTFNSISTDPSNYLERPAYPLQGYGLPISKGHVSIFLENRQEAVSLEQQRDRWISDVAHELKTPLTSIRLVAETLQSRVAPPLTTWVNRLLQEVIRLSKLVDDVLNMSHLERRQPQLEAEDNPNRVRPDLVSLVHAAWQSIEPLAVLKQVDLDYQGPPQLTVNLSAGLMHRLLFNLMSNAIKYSPHGQSIQLRLSVQTVDETAEGANKGDAHLLIEVIDAGSGFNPKDLPHVFDRFYRADLSRTREADFHSSLKDTDKESSPTVEVAEISGSGTGLGLAIVRQIVESYQGRVEARNSPETGGGWLSVWLPNQQM